MAFKVLGSKAATLLDKELMSTGGFSIDQLMELAGLSVSQAIYKKYPPASHPNVLLLIGPGNNGGDGLVAARHLKLLGYAPRYFYPKKSARDLFQRLTSQLALFNIEEIHDIHHVAEALANGSVDCVVDSLFGFSFHPPIRQPFGDLIRLISDTPLPLISVDVPSGWDVNEGPTSSSDHVSLSPSVLVSLSCPKPCALKFRGDSHFVGGRFLSQSIIEKYGIDHYNYAGLDQVVEL